jgi:outer membrane biosynthesis protein TonB
MPGNRGRDAAFRRCTRRLPRRHIQGIVRFTATIGRDGRVVGASLISGHPLLVPAAQEAIKQYEYQFTLLNGEPAEVVTEVDVPFPTQRT